MLRFNVRPKIRRTFFKVKQARTQDKKNNFYILDLQIFYSKQLKKSFQLLFWKNAIQNYTPETNLANDRIKLSCKTKQHYFSWCLFRQEHITNKPQQELLSKRSSRELKVASSKHKLLRSREKGCTIVRVHSYHRESTHLPSRWYFKKNESGGIKFHFSPQKMAYKNDQNQPLRPLCLCLLLIFPVASTHRFPLPRAEEHQVRLTAVA